MWMPKLELSERRQEATERNDEDNQMASIRYCLDELVKLCFRGRRIFLTAKKEDATWSSV